MKGAWRLLSFVFTDADGELFYPLGRDPAGYFVVTGDGHATLSFTATGRDRFAANDLFAGADDELANAAKGYVSFGGPCEVGSDAITIHVKYSLFPNWIGQQQVRLYTLDGDRLTLRTDGPKLFGGVERRAEARLERER